MTSSEVAHNIWIISKYASSKEYGFETRLFALAREFVKMGRKPVIFSSDSNHFGTFPHFRGIYNRESIEGIDVWWIKTFKYKSTISFKRVLSWLDFEIKLFLMNPHYDRKPDVIIVSSLSLLTILNGIRLKKKFECKLIFEIRDIWPLSLVEEGGYNPRNIFVKLLSWIEKYGYRKSDIVVGTMPNISAHVHEVAGPGIKCQSIPFGFDPKFYEDNLAPQIPVTSELIPSNKFIVGYAGSIGKTNALNTIIETIKQMSGNSDIFFVFIGDGDLRTTYIKELDGFNNVLFLPKVERSQVRNLLQKCTILYFSVYKSKVWEYGMSLNKMTDYMMSARPVIGSYSGYQSMINEANSGVFIPAEDVSALKEAFLGFSKMTRDELDSIGLNGKKWLLNNRSWHILAKDYLHLCDNLLIDND